MGINISISNSEFKGKSETLNGLMLQDTIQPVDISLEKIKVEGEAKLLTKVNYLSDIDIDGLVDVIEKEAQHIKLTSDDEITINRMIAEFNKKREPKKSILKKYLPDLLVGTLANVVSTYVCRF